MKLRVRELVQRTADIRSLVLEHPDALPLPGFTAGAHIDVDVRLPDGQPARRSYSLVNRPDDLGHYEIAVLHQREGLGGSAWIHDTVRSGALLDVQDPRNAFPLADDAAHHVLVAGGIGITPLLCMARVLDQQGASVELHYFGRAPEALAFRDELRELTRVVLQEFCSSDPAPVVQRIRELTTAPQPRHHLYVCGPGGMIQTLLDSAAAQGWPANQVHHERFGAASPAVGDSAFQVELLLSGQRFEVSVGETLLDALLARGIDAPHGCRAGSCGSCLVPVASGEIDHRDSFLTEDDRRDGGLMCVCVSRARGC